LLVARSFWRPGSDPNKQARARRAESDASGTAKADRHLIAIDDDRYSAATLAETEHPLQIECVFLDVDVLERDMPPLTILTGGLRVGSSVLAEDRDHGAIVTLAPLHGV
jgi:hypothetical protein